MNNQATREELLVIDGLAELRQRVAELEVVGTERQQAEEALLIDSLVELRQRVAELEAVDIER